MNTKYFNGFLRADKTNIVNANNEVVLLKGWGLGNWLLPEGYMWCIYNRRFDRPRHMKMVLKELTGSEYSKHFWKTFIENYITKEDIKLMSEYGYNSLRLPMNWEFFLEDEVDLIPKDDGFKIIDKLIKWCEEYKIYLFLDLHGAPGGQTGSNIDDCIDDLPRLFIDDEYYQKALYIWEEIAKRYNDCETIGGYDLLNEPIKPMENSNEFVPKLIKFYDNCIQLIRKYDKNHLISVEGHHWATATDVFCKKYDDNSCFHFHRYASLPEKDSFIEFINLSKKYDVPLWLGETGENNNIWYTSMYHMSEQFGIGYNLWPWKKMNCTNSPVSIKTPNDWNLIDEYTQGGKKVPKDKAIEIFDEYLENILLKNCDINNEVNNHVNRHGSFEVLAVDFDELPGEGISYSGIYEGSTDYRNNTKMNIFKARDIEQRFFFDSCHDKFDLILSKDEFTSYSFYPQKQSKLSVVGKCTQKGILQVFVNNVLEIEKEIEVGSIDIDNVCLYEEGKNIVKIYVENGIFLLEKLQLFEL